MNEVLRRESRIVCTLMPSGKKDEYLLSFGTTVNDPHSQQRILTLQKKARGIDTLSKAVASMRDDAPVLACALRVCNELVSLNQKVVLRKVGVQPVYPKHTLWIRILPRFYGVSVTVFHSGKAEVEIPILAALRTCVEQGRSIRALGPTFRNHAVMLNALHGLQKQSIAMFILNVGWNSERGQWIEIDIDLSH